MGHCGPKAQRARTPCTDRRQFPKFSEKDDAEYLWHSTCCVKRKNRILKKKFNLHPRICSLIFLRGEREGRRTGERNIGQLPPVGGDRTRHLGLCPDQEQNPWPFAVRDGTPTEPVASVRILLLFCRNKHKVM